jgi:penicillin amidase
MLRKVLLVVLWLLALSVAGLAVFTQLADRYQDEGVLRLSVLSAPVRVVRDEQGIPYIYAESLDDAIRAQGWVTAQDRLLQLDFERYLAAGRLSELIGESALESDIALRLAGTARHGRRHAELLGAADRRFYGLYLEGLNAYIRQQTSEHQFGFALLGTRPEPWTLADVMTLQYFLNWSSSVNLQAELISQELIDRLGAARAAEIRQITVNPDDNSGTGLEAAALPVPSVALNLKVGAGWLAPGPRPFEIGSNQWVMSGARSVSGAPVLVNDPHLDARSLPGIWHPVGLITPEFRAVGAAGPGIPGLAVGRTSHIAFGVTNAYADVVDLFIETEDPQQPGHYLEGGKSVPFEVIEETLRVRERPGSSKFRTVPLKIRLTHRGPVISDHGMSVPDGKLISMRWSAPEAMAADTGQYAFFTARSVEEARRAVWLNTAPYNYVIADTEGNIGHATGGRVPIRMRGDGSSPQPVIDASDAWAGFIPPEQMPGQLNPARGWVGNANHRTVPAAYPYAYSTYFAASWRYRRMLELLDQPGRLGAADHWKFMRDTHNSMAAQIAPLMAHALLAAEDTRDLGQILADWNHADDVGLVAPTVFQAVYREFAHQTFVDELGTDLCERMLGSWYYWHERLAQMVRVDASLWFDDTGTPEVESRDEIFRRAARLARSDLTKVAGADPGQWQWGQLHTVTFSSPLVPGKGPASVLGAGTHPKEGSGETLNRASYKFNKPYDATGIASLRFVADLADPDKVMAVLVGGASGRQFDAHLKDQTPAWLSGEARYWWFSDAAIQQHSRSELLLQP